MDLESGFLVNVSYMPTFNLSLDFHLNALGPMLSLNSSDEPAFYETPPALNCSSPAAQADDLCNPLIPQLLLIADKLDICVLPVVIFVGLVGNFLSFLVFTVTYLRHMSSSVYLAALAATDFVYLVIVLTSWFGHFDIDLFHVNVSCQVSVYLTYVTSFLSVWYVVCFTVERHLMVCFPLSRQKICQPRRSKIVVCFLAVLALAMYNFALWTSEVDVVYGIRMCNVHDSDFFQLVTTINNVDTVLTLVLPALIISVSNVRISYALSKFYRTYHTGTSSAVVATGGGSFPRGGGGGGGGARSSGGARASVSTVSGPLLGPSSSYNRLQMRVTKMLVVVSSVFLLCNLPSHAIRVYAFARSALDADYQPSGMLLVVQRLAMLLYYAGFSTNFILYNISGRTFRRAFRRLFHCLSHRSKAFICTRVGLIRSRTRPQSKAALRLKAKGRKCSFN